MMPDYSRRSIPGLILGVGAGLLARPQGANAQGAEPPSHIKTVLLEASYQYGPTYRFLRELCRRESGFDPTAYNRAGYEGLFQYDRARWSEESRKYGFELWSPYDPWAAAAVTAAVVANYPLWQVHGIWPPSRYCGSPWA
jgi:hypothetical protein